MIVIADLKAAQKSFPPPVNVIALVFIKLGLKFSKITTAVLPCLMILTLLSLLAI